MRKIVFKKQEIPKELMDLPVLLATLLSNRGVNNAKEADIFLNPDYERDLHDPYLLKDMDKAVKRILSAVEKGEKIVIYSDYDADGIPGAVILSDFFKYIGYTNVSVYIPHRHDEGYGVHKEAIDEFSEQNVSLIITIDCGTTDVSPITLAQSRNIDVIIVDHHVPGEKLPPAYAILNPKRDGCEYPEDMLCGAGVTFKLIQALLLVKNFNLPKGKEKWMLDMVGIATLSDMVPLTGENRALAFYGLTVLRHARRPGVKALLESVKIFPSKLSEDDISFMIAPRLNAASRMGDPYDAFKLLSTDDRQEAQMLASHLNSINDERKGIVSSLVKEIKHVLSERKLSNVVVVGNPKWKPSLLGLVATRIVEEYERPVFLWGRAESESIKGSCRSEGNTDVVLLMEGAKDHFLKFGGHKLAGGFSVSHEHIHTLEDSLNKVFKTIEHVAEESLMHVDTTLSLDEVNDRTYGIVSSLAPFGIANPKPTFLFKQADVFDVSLFGKGKEHLKLTLSSPNGNRVSAIGFFMKPENLSFPVEKGEKTNLVATLEKSYFAGRTELRLRIIDTVG
ncbi:MAG: single-stranded-DNA-specific exonuclease RecJ [Patescibacteria group bacterium]|nr:single-stranded-DNA-specific exonuclease RecJ [bacterium]MDZ4241116.1 single-stranded-DNA-specific exonuclease RecJ [Patescibacteria group bacterium]